MGSGLRKWGIENCGWESHDELGSLSYPDFRSEYLDPGGVYFQPDTWADCQPGSQFAYSTPGFDLLGGPSGGLDFLDGQSMHGVWREFAQQHAGRVDRGTQRLGL